MQQNTCRGCLRYERRDGSWAVVEPESKELLALLLKKPRGLGAVRLADAKRWFRDLRREHVYIGGLFKAAPELSYVLFMPRQRGLRGAPSPTYLGYPS